MLAFTIYELILITAIAGGLSFMAIWGLAMFDRLGAPASESERDENASVISFLFEGDVLIDLDGSDHSSLSVICTWGDLRKWLMFRFPNLPVTLDDCPSGGTLHISAWKPDDEATLSFEPHRGATCVVLHDICVNDAAAKHDLLHVQEKLKEDSAALHSSPYAMWKTDTEGKLVWRNLACVPLLTQNSDTLALVSKRAANIDNKQKIRHAIERAGDQPPLWLEIKRAAIDAGFIHYATDISATVKAEDAQRRFVQTLTKTFASLATGLAVFGKNQQLALFNPALIDLTGVSAEFLSGRPTLVSFFDTLRDRQVLPEPRNYANWRTQLQDMVRAASDGQYQETWCLPSGLTYRVTGRPHPDGAVAFLFEDITAEISLTRRFRAQIDLRQSVLDRLSEAIAVFGPDNILIFCNTAFCNLTGTDPDSIFADMTTADVARICRDTYPDPDFWGRIIDQRTSESFGGIRSDVIPSVKSGSSMLFDYQSIPGGAMLSGTSFSEVIDTEKQSMFS